MLIGITGTNGAGKGIAVNYLVQKGFTHYSVREEIVAEMEKKGLPHNRTNMNEVGTELRSLHGADYFARIFIERAHHEGITDVVIESIRTPYEAMTIKKTGGKILAIDADVQLRYERIVARDSATDRVTFEEFQKQEAREMNSEDMDNPAKIDINAVLTQADVIIMNEGTLEDFHQHLDKVLKN